MKLDDLKNDALNPVDNNLRNACTPERILAMIACIKAADKLRDFIVDEESDNVLTLKYDRARAELEEA